ncbi:MAG: hypothetical protein AAFO82_03730, partial [Bacteroidota bacterium]
YNQSILLFKGKNVEITLESLTKNETKTNSYISLSPLIMDLSVYLKKETQTPEIYYFIGKSGKQYQFAKYRNELIYNETVNEKSNKQQTVNYQNNDEPKLDELYEQLEHVFSPFKTEKR